MSDVKGQGVRTGVFHPCEADERGRRVEKRHFDFSQHRRDDGGFFERAPSLTQHIRSNCAPRKENKTTYVKQGKHDPLEERCGLVQSSLERFVQMWAQPARVLSR